jgi:nitrogen regulatory protein PII
MENDTPFSKLFSKISAKLSGPQSQPLRETARQTPPELTLLFCIVDLHKARDISEIFAEEKVRFHFICGGRGTAKSEVLDLLGIGAGDKAVVLCLEQSVMVPVLLKEVRKKFGFHSPGAGIAFTVPLSAINDPVLLVFKQSIHKNEKIAAEQKLIKSKRETVPDGGEGENMAEQFSHDLIVSVVNQGYSDELMNTAREAGASGGTVLNARGQAHEGAVKFFGISVQEEKEVIIILTSREKKVDIMRKLCEAHGLNSKAQGIIFSLPVDNVMGLSFE